MALLGKFLLVIDLLQKMFGVAVQVEIAIQDRNNLLLNRSLLLDGLLELGHCIFSALLKSGLFKLL